jgi:ankyrin repeat protein
MFTSILTLTPLRRFRWVYCQIETLRRCFPGSIRRTLDELPETLDGTYEQTLRGIDKQKRDYAYRLFQCLVISKRPLRVEELAELFAIQPDAETVPKFDACLRPENPEEFVLSACSTLVTVVNVDLQKIVQFSHFSVREYLISDRIANSEHVSRFHVLPRLAHALVARASLSVLLQLDDCIDRDKIGNFPLALYAAQYWVDHAQFENVSSDIRHGIEFLFDKNKPYFAAWLQLYNIDDPFNLLAPTVDSARPYPNPLYYAALCGFHDIAEHLIDAHPQDVSARGGSLVTPLHAAVSRGHLSIAMLLLERGADMESRDFWSSTPLHVASYRGYAEVVSLLIARGADLNAEEETLKTPLHLASEGGSQDIARLLLENSVGANHPDIYCRTPLHLASGKGYDHIVQLLLNHGADANYLDSHGLTPLHWSSERGHDHIVRLLLDRGADTNHQDGGGLTPLHIASREGDNHIVQLLLDHSADVNHPEIDGWTPLCLASRKGHEHIARLLLDHGANANCSNNHGLTPLHFASEMGYDHIVRLLFYHGADLNHVDIDGLTPLRVALQMGQDHIVRLLLEYGADLNYPDKDGLTPLGLALDMGYTEIAELLLTYIDGSAEDGNRNTPMILAP